MVFVSRCRAKINLFLHVVGRRPDGQHEIESLVAFASCADTLTLTPTRELSLRVDGPTAASSGESCANLVLRAANHLRSRVEGLRLGAFHLTKRLPVAAGLGGGSADAAAALRLLAEANALKLDDRRLMEAAQATGADVPVCVSSRARVMAGDGDRLGPPLVLPPLVAVLVNPGIPVQTKAVFAEMGLRPGEGFYLARHPLANPPSGNGHPDSLMVTLAASRNDMEDAAAVLAPVIGDVLAVLSAAKGCRLARMSGSGATCFGLFSDCRRAKRAGHVIRRDHPGWWVMPTLVR